MLNRNRRQFLFSLTALALPLPVRAVTALGGEIPVRTQTSNASPTTTRTATAPSAAPFLLSASWDDGAPAAGLTTASPVALPGRGHAIVPLPNGQAIVLSRRLGDWLAKIDWRAGQRLKLLAAEPSRHYFGHAILSPDGKTLITTENDDESGEGVLGLYAVDTLKRLGELRSHGIGPHELIWFESGKLLAVANGGILTLPETGRTKLNLGQMNPALTLIEWPAGRKVAEYVMPDKSLSIRHLARTQDGTLGLALQAEYSDAAAHRDAPLLAILHKGKIRLAEQPPGLMGYGASIATVGNQFLVSALRGSALARWQSDGQPLGAISFPRPAGVASDGQQAWVSSETGVLAHYDAQAATLPSLHGQSARRWDSHLTLAVA